MTGAVALAAIIGLVSLLAGVALGWYLRRANNWCAGCGNELICMACGSHAARSREHATSVP
jgi:hypothetical protein